jgi:hypothetical protein
VVPMRSARVEIVVPSLSRWLSTVVKEGLNSYHPRACTLLVISAFIVWVARNSIRSSIVSRRARTAAGSKLMYERYLTKN